MKPTPTQKWWTATEIADAGLPDMPATRQGVERLVKRDGWRNDSNLARRRAGRGGGWEYSWKLFPTRAQQHLLSLVGIKPPKAQPEKKKAMSRKEVWAWFDAQPEKTKAMARSRLELIMRIEGLVAGGEKKTVAVDSISEMASIAPRSVWGWFEQIRGVRSDDWLPYLAPRHRISGKSAKKSECSPEFFSVLKSDFLRLSGPSFTSCYRRALRIADDKGWDVLPERTMRRMYKRNVSKATETLARKGSEALKQMYPPQVRDKTTLHAMEAVNADFHKFDLFVRFPPERGEEKPWVGRPQMVAFQDIHSGRILSWRIDREPNALAVQLAAGDMVEEFGIPEHVLLDNGREFAAKAITGGAPTRYRFKVREDDLPGLFVALNSKIHWATPYSGQSKPIERTFRDLCDAVAKDPRFEGAYTGNRPDAKPENYGSRAIELDDFLAVLAEGIQEHNARPDRRSEVAFGRSFNDAFEESYAKSPIRKATEEQRRLWLMGAENLRAHSKTGAVSFLGNEFYAPWLLEYAGERIIGRFDPADIWSGLHIYSASNEYLGHAPCRAKVGFFDMAEARSHAKARREMATATRKATEAHKKFTAAELGQMLSETAPEEAPAPEAKVVKAAFGKGVRKAPKVDDAFEAEAQAQQAAIVENLSSRRVVEPSTEEDNEFVFFKRALQLEQKLRNGEAITPDQQRWLSSYQDHPDYAGKMSVWKTFGDDMFG